jgi:hypothetical protein
MRTTEPKRIESTSKAKKKLWHISECTLRLEKDIMVHNMDGGIEDLGDGYCITKRCMYGLGISTAMFTDTRASDDVVISTLLESPTHRRYMRVLEITSRPLRGGLFMMEFAKMTKFAKA